MLSKTLKKSEKPFFNITREVTLKFSLIALVNKCNQNWTNTSVTLNKIEQNSMD